MAAEINGCALFLTVKRQSLQRRCACMCVFVWFLSFLLLFALVWVVSIHDREHARAPGHCCGTTVARTNHYLVVVGLERSAAWNVRLCSTAARCSRALLKCPIKEGRAGIEHVGATVHVRKIRRSICVLVFVFIPSCSVSCTLRITCVRDSSEELMKSAWAELWSDLSTLTHVRPIEVISWFPALPLAPQSWDKISVWEDEGKGGHNSGGKRRHITPR